MNVHGYCRALLAEARAEAKEKGIAVPRGLKAMRVSKRQFFVESKTAAGEYVKADCAYDAKARYIFKVCGKWL